MLRPFAALLALVLVVASAPAQAAPFESGIIRIEHDGVVRSALIDAQTDVRDAPVLVVLHGALAGPSTVRRKARVRLARRGWIVLWPQALGEWNDGRTDRSGQPFDTADDVGFLRALIGRLVRDGAADPDRVFAAGPSIGGVMALRLLCEAPDLVAGIAVAIASLPEGRDCREGPPRPVLYIHGTDDPLMPPEGGRIGGWNPLVRERGRVEPVDATLRRLARRNGCNGAAEVALPDSEPADRSTVVLREYTGCAARLVHYVVEGGGHTWPGASPSGLGERIVGATNQDFKATRVVEAFFQGIAGRARQR